LPNFQILNSFSSIHNIILQVLPYPSAEFSANSLQPNTTTCPSHLQLGNTHSLQI
jgi:hypothetical protein